MAEFLLEIGFEEMPAPWLAGLAEQARGLFERLRLGTAPRAGRRPVLLHAAAARGGGAGGGSAGGPRREGLGAFAQGREGRRRGVDERGERVREEGGCCARRARRARPRTQRFRTTCTCSFVKKTPGRGSAEVLPSILGTLLRGLAFPKRMSWDAWLDDGKGAFPFGRPIRWMIALLDGAVVPFAIYELVGGRKGAVVVESGTLTHGHRFLPRGSEERSTPVRSLAELRRRAAPPLRSPRARRARATRRRAAREAQRRPARRERPRPGRRMARPRRVPDGAGRPGARGVPLAADRGAGDRARPPPEVRAAPLEWPRWSASRR